MKKLTDKEIRRLLSARGTLEPPEGLADRIKAEIPEVLQVGGTGLEPENGRTMPPRSAGLRPFWLIAASLLVFIGAGFMVVRLLGPSENLARRIALDGVTVIEDVVVTVPERSTVERQKLASAMTMRQVHRRRGSGTAAPPRRPGRRQGRVRNHRRRSSHPSNAESRRNQSRGRTRAPRSRWLAVMPQSRAADEGAIAGHPATSRHGDVRRPSPTRWSVAAAPLQAASGSVIVVVQDAQGSRSSVPPCGSTCLTGPT